jgi:hypothetical protein
MNVGIDAEGQMMIRKAFKAPLIAACCAIVTSACDTGESIASSTDAIEAAQVEAQLEAELALADAEVIVDWDEVPLPAIAGVTPAFDVPPASQAKKPWTVESFYFTSANFLSLTQMEGGLFAPLPVGMPTLPPELEDGFLLGFTFYDQNDEIVGFGTEQEVLDLADASGVTTYTLTIPGRGTIMLAHDEEFAYLFEELDDMVADQEFVREFDPPLVNIHTVPGSAKIIGGTGEFDHIKGSWREISLVYELNLLTGLHEVGIVLQILYL